MRSVSDIVVVSGDPQPGSRTLHLATLVGERLAEQRGHTPPVLVDVAELGAGVLTPGDEASDQALLDVQEATVLVVASPACKGSYAGALKALLDRLPANALAGVVAVPVVTADVQPMADLAETFLARLLGALGADVVDFGLTATQSELIDPSFVADQYVAAYGS
ncbi:NAD(P)H-dependent oxidoreductase [Actinoplanes sp. NPDC049548]|uniref:NADPH-dependent FMN reductase n=1 Tax=Actinoplanes sp. NPDC049548 TaxID=3155152 RepID=UPI003426F315